MVTPDFESMSNDQLRQQMEELGLPKVPITASTRNILIKRLQNHVSGGGSAKTPAGKARRETMHVVKYSSDDDSDRDAAKEKLKKKMENHKNARRQTIGGAALGATPTPRPSQVPVPVAVAQTDKPSRKSMRATPTKTMSTSGIVPPVSRNVKATIPVTIEDSDEEEVILAPKKTVDRRSKSNTPTLAKSDTVVTSYKQVVDTVHEEPIDLVDDNEDDDDEVLTIIVNQRQLFSFICAI